jgi:surfactin synthase thioesterase subunit
MPNDDMVYPDEVAGWARHTEAGFTLNEVPGDHWFLNRNFAALQEHLLRITRLVDPRAPRAVETVA